MSRERVAVLGFGAWGTAVAALLAEAGHAVRAWTIEAEVVAGVDRERRNSKYLPDCPLPPGLEVTSDAARVLREATVILWALPTQHLRSAANRLRAEFPPGALHVSLAKGFETGSRLRPTAVLTEELTLPRCAALLGPSHAEEVARRQPTLVAACAEESPVAERVQQLFHGERFRVYRNDDVIGAECGAALKNVIAIAAGIADGLGFGDNAKGALVTRGLGELSRLGAALGGRQETFFGLTGLGDLITTCFSRHSRNRRVGEEMARGRVLEVVLRDLGQVAEGVETSRVALELAHGAQVPVPITEQVVAVLFEGKTPGAALEDLMARDPRAE